MTIMFVDAAFKKYKIDENNVSIGVLEVNQNLLKMNDFVQPFIREQDYKMIIKIGDRNYDVLNKYIIASLNDYYNRLMNASKSDRNMMTKTYNHLYEMWVELHEHKKNNNLVEMDKTYDLFSYELYVLGYTN